MSELSLDVHGLSKRFRIGARQERYVMLRDALIELGKKPLRAISSACGRNDDNTIMALEDISFQVQPGEKIALIGGNGAGKSTLLKVISRIMEPTQGYVDVVGRVGSLLEVGTGFHNELTGRENIFLNGAILGMKKAEIDRRFDEIVDFAGVDKFVDTPVKRYSSGMYLRLAFAVAAHLSTEILLVDEVLTVGDAEFQRKCLGRLDDIASGGRTILFVSHNIAAVRSLCDKGVVLERGRMIAQGEIDECIEVYYRSLGSLNADADDAKNGTTSSHSRFGPIQINRSSKNTVSQSDGFEVSTTFDVAGQPESFTIYCRLEDMHGRLICRLRQESDQLGFQNGVSGQRTVSVEFPPLWLTPGLYAVDFRAEFSAEYSSGQFAVSDKHPLDVGGLSSSMERKSRVEAILNPQVDWNLSNGNGRGFA